jgi:hypothetical protein
MSLAIYGDSYGVKNNSSHSFWGDVITTKLNTNCVNYCENASSLFYSYKIFLETFHKHSTIVFLVTLPYRYTKPIQLSVTKDKNHHISGPHNIDQILERYRDLSMADQRTLTLLEHWFMMLDEDFYKTAQELIVDDIVKKRPDTIIIPCFYESLTTDQYKHLGLSGYQHMYGLLEIQCKSLGLDFNTFIHDYEEKKEIINAHFTPELNNIFADLVYHRIIKDSWNNTLWPSSSDRINHEFKFEDYYKKIT